MFPLKAVVSFCVAVAMVTMPYLIMTLCISVCSSLTRNLPVLISLASCQTTKVIHEIVSIHQVPLLHHYQCEEIPHSSSPLLLPLVPGEQTIEHVALEVIKSARWREVVIFYEAPFGKSNKIHIALKIM